MDESRRESTTGDENRGEWTKFGGSRREVKSVDEN